MNARLQRALFLLFAVWTGGLAAQEAAGPGTYRVQIAVSPGEDVAAVAKGVAATYGGYLESAADGQNTVTMTIDGSVRELLERDPRVRQVQGADASKAATPQVARPSLALPAAASAARLQTNSTASPWTTGTYAYDAAGNITEIGVDRFAYDVYSRIEKGTAAGQSQEYSYDRYGNLTSITTGTTTIPLTVNADTNRLTAFNGISVSYDDAGQVLQAGAASYTYDGSGMMTSSGTSGVPSNLYIYTPGDERIASVLVSGNAEISSSWTFRDASGKLLRRFDRQNQTGGWAWIWRQDYIYNGSQMLASENDVAPKTRHYFPDHLGSQRLITDGGGMQVGLAAYLPFGAALTSGLSDAKRFTGHERDPSGLDYMHARSYNWGWGRFLSVDPGKDWDMRQPQSWNMYSYVRNNPINAIDPTGRYQCGGANADQDCKQIDTAVGDINKARDNLPENSAHRAALDAVVDLLGTRDDGNKTNIVLTTDADVNAQASTVNGITTITMNLSNLVGPESSTARIVDTIGGSLRSELAGFLGHEADHGVLERVYGNPATASQEFAFELRAYTTQGIVHQGLGLNNSAGGYWWNGRLDQRNILRGALDSLASWCAQPGARGCR